ncbi:MAG: SDR family oxidoreductase, partial [Pseudomonadales bacterium]|nr:SDR family oxidoreductase [Pseudomonadales bacterium]NIX06867.1 SDR family oxidoreductase [Pseudomonadales bacterium]
AIAEEMARAGAQVVISSRKADLCDEVAGAINAELDGEAGGAVAIPAHIGHKEELERLVTQTREKLGKIDVLVCNAAVNPYFGSMSELPDSAFDKILDV